jgi:hypothetical protein
MVANSELVSDSWAAWLRQRLHRWRCYRWTTSRVTPNNETSIPQPSDGQVLAVENLGAEHKRGIHLMKLVMDEVSIERGGTEVHIRKESGNEQKIPSQRIQNRIVRRLVIRPWPGVRAVELGRR